MIKPVVITRNLIKNFGTGPSLTKVLRGLDITIHPGEFVIIFGPSGSGKSTLLNIINGLETPTSGEVWIDGEDISHLDDVAKAHFHQQKIGMIFQAYNLIPSLTVSQNIALPLVFSKVPPLERRPRVEALLKEFELTGLANRLPSEISGGQAQRVGIMRALITRPPIIVADEPTGNLDSAASTNVMNLFDSLNDKYHHTLIVVTHDQSLFRYADRIIHILDGNVVKESARVTSKKHHLNPNSAYNSALKLYQSGQKHKILTMLRLLLSDAQLSSFDERELTHTLEFLIKRMQGQISDEDLFMALDKPLREGGAGLYSSTAQHISDSFKTLLEFGV